MLSTQFRYVTKERPSKNPVQCNLAAPISEIDYNSVIILLYAIT
jgi:hypothetical protein